LPAVNAFGKPNHPRSRCFIRFVTESRLKDPGTGSRIAPALVRDSARIFPVLMLLLLGSCAGEKEQRAGAIILISIDTLRSDRLPAYGYRAIRTPHLDRFRQDSVLFERAYSHSPLTLPSHATLFTGLLPQGHGVRDNVGFTMNDQAQTIAQTLAAARFATGAAVSAYVLRPETGIGRGFDFYDATMPPAASEEAIGYIQRSGAETIAKAKEWIRGRGQSPLFFFLHLYEPHTPYQPPPEYRAAHPYDGEVAYSDALVGEFLDFLREQKLYDEALVIVLSDHGEGLGEHGEEEHGIFLYRESLQVPLMIKLPGARSGGLAVADPVGLSDVPATILDHARLPAAKTDGSSLLPLMDGHRAAHRPLYAETYLPRFHFGWSELHSLINGSHHYVHAPKPELYDLKSDPSESRNILAENRRLYTSMRRETEERIGPLPAQSRIDPEEARKLAALGYLGGGASPAGADLPDPKDKIASWPLIKTAFTLFRERNYEQLLPLTRQLRETNPGMPDAWFLSIRAAAKLGRGGEAVRLLQQGLRAIPGNVKLAIEGANLFLDLGRAEEAIAHAELALQEDPAQAHEILARCWLAKGDLTRAESEIEAAEQAKKNRPLTLLTKGRIAQARGRLNDALQIYDKAVAAIRETQMSPVPTLHLYRGDVLVRLGRVADAEQAFREEIRIFPDEVQPYINLTLLYLSSQRPEQATKAIYEMVERIPTRRGYAAAIRIMELAGDERGKRYWTARSRERFP
jgi:arylsulfatase A-like enzyme/Flp pilus assembly protein TadD